MVDLPHRTLETHDLHVQLRRILTGRWFVELTDGNEINLHQVTHVHHDEQTEFQHIELMDLATLGRTLVLDGRIQMSECDEFLYHEPIVHPAFVARRATDVLVLGGGDGCTLREVLKWPTVRRARQVEIDPAMIELFKSKHPAWNNGAFEDPRVEIQCRDAFKILDDNDTWDLIIGDLTEPYNDTGIAADLSSSIFSPRFYQAIRQRLNDGGIFVAQTGGIWDNEDQHIKIINEIRGSFKYSTVCYEYIPAFRSLWTFTLASDSRIEFPGHSAINGILQGAGVKTRYYNGKTHYRMFAPQPFIEAKY